jgi:hypothetical protein
MSSKVDIQRTPWLHSSGWHHSTIRESLLWWFSTHGTDLSLGGASAAPVFAEVTQNALHQLGVAPDRK